MLFHIIYKNNFKKEYLSIKGEDEIDCQYESVKKKKKKEKEKTQNKTKNKFT